MMIPKKFRKGDRCFAFLISVVFATVYSIPINAQPKTSTLSQLSTTENLSNRSGTQHPVQAFGGQLAIFLGHEKLVTSAKFSPDGRYILTTSWDETARLWDTQGNILIVFRGHEDSVHSAEFSPDGRQIFTVSKDDSGRLWDSSSGKLLAEFPKNTIDIFTRGVFSPNGRYILATNAYTTYLWDTSANTLRGFEGGGFQGDRSAVFSPDGQQILTEGKDNTARLWDTSDKLMAELRGHENAISSAVFSPDGRRILTASWDHTARLWDTQGKILAVFRGHQGWVNSVVFSPNGRQILTASNDNTASLWDSSGNLLVELRGHKSGVRSAEFSPDGRQILTVSRDQTARLWDTQGNLLAVFQGGESIKSINSAEFSPDGRQILTSSSYNARLWDISAAIAAQTEQAIALQTLEQVLPERNAQIVEFRGHKGLFSRVTFSPDGKYILTTTSLGHTARLWDTQGNLLTVFQGHEDWVLSAVFSPDGRYILTTSRDNTARLWDTQGNLLTILREHNYTINHAVFSPDGRYILTGNKDGIARLSDTSGNLLVEFRGHQDWVNSAVFSPDGRFILTASSDDTARLWDISGNLLTVFRGHKEGAFIAVFSAVFSPDGQQILTTSSDGTARLWDIQGNFLAVFDQIYNAVFSPDGHYILTVGKDRATRLWDVSAVIAAQSKQMPALQAFQQHLSKNNAQLAEFRGHTDDVNSAKFSPNGNHILTSSKDKTVRLWDIQGNLLKVFDRNYSSVFSPDGRYILIFSNENTVRLWDTSNNFLVELRGHDDNVNSAVFSPDGRQILTTSKDKTARLWDSLGNLLTVFRGHDGNVNSAEFSPDGRQILTSSEDKTARLWDSSGNLLTVFQGHEWVVSSAKFSPNGRQILTVSADKTARLWDTQGNLLAVFQGGRNWINSAEFSPDGRQILIRTSSRTANLWDTSGNLLVELRGHNDDVNSAVFSPDGRYILTASEDGTARLWNSSGELLIEIQRSNSAVFSPDGNYILTTNSLDKTARLWDISGNLLAEFRGHENRVNSAVFSPDGKHILTASDDDTARMWDVSGAIYAYAPERLLREGSQLNQQDTIESKQQALQKLEEALSFYRADKNSAKAAHTLLLIGNINANLGQFQAALDSYTQALPLSREARAKAEEAAILNSLGQLYNNLADPKTALDYHKQALPLLYQLNDKGNAAKTLNNIGDIQAATEEWEDALKSYNQALIISRPADDLAAEATALSGIGSTYITSKEWSTALNAYNQSLLISRHLKDKIKETTILNQMGKIHAALGDNSTALKHYKQALALAQQLGYKTEEANIHYNQAILNRQQNNLTAAKTDIETSIQIIEALRTQIASQELRQSYFARNQDYYQFYIDLLMQLHQQNPDRGYDALALHASERARARILLEQLTEASLDLKADLDPALKAEEKRLNQALNAADRKRINLLAGSPSNDELEAVKAEIDNILNQLQNLEVQIRRANPAYANLKYPEPLTLEGIQNKILDDKTLLLQYALGKDRSYLFLVSKTALKTYKLPPKAEIEAAVEQYRELLQSPDFTDLSQGQQLSQMLLGQIAGELKEQRLVIVGDGKLQLLPFAALPWVSGASLAPLLKNHEIITLPSATSLAVQREQWQKREQAPRTLAVIADPVFKPNDPRLGDNATTSIAGDLSQVDSLIRNSCGDFDRLPYAATEAEQILALVPNAQEFSALGFDANYATATNPNLSQYRIVHLATHGCIQDNPLLSNLALSFFNADGQEAENRSLKLQDIYNLKLNADLVILSACQTGTGKEVQGEGVIGLTRGFMYAGARRVAVSLWSVNDRATSILMSDYYRKMLEQKVDPAAALRQAQLAMWQSDSYSAPYYWAAFTLQGDW